MYVLWDVGYPWVGARLAGDGGLENDARLERVIASKLGSYKGRVHMYVLWDVGYPWVGARLAGDGALGTMRGLRGLSPASLAPTRAGA